MSDTPPCRPSLTSQIRRKAGQDMTTAKEELKKKEAIKDQQRKAAEKKADVSLPVYRSARTANSSCRC